VIYKYNPNSERYVFDSEISIADIKMYFRQNNSGTFFNIFETGLDSNRFDLIRLDPYREYVRIFEFKSCRADFRADKKWENYLKYCHTFTFVCPREVIQKDELPPGIGLLWIYKWTHKMETPWSREMTWRLCGEWIKRPRKREIKEGVLRRLAFMLVYRTIWRKDDVF